MVSVERRVSAFVRFAAGYGVCRFLGSAAIGILYDLPVPAALIFSVAAELAGALVFILMSTRRGNRKRISTAS